jgi:hypothetical protein
LVKNGEVELLSTMFSIHNMSFLLTKFEQQRFKKTIKKRRMNNLEP